MFLSKLKFRENRLLPKVSIILMWMATFIYFFYFFSHTAYLQERKRERKEASSITKNILEKIKMEYPDSLENRKLIFLNLPDGIKGDLWPAYIFRNGLNASLSLIYSGRVGIIKQYRTKAYLPIERYNKPWRHLHTISKEQIIHYLKQNYEIYTYLPYVDTLRKVKIEDTQF